MKLSEAISRFFVLILVAGVLAIPLLVRLVDLRQGIELRGRMAETGGWSPEIIRAQVGQPLHLSLTSDDVMHGFAVGQMDIPSVDIFPGQVSELSLTFDQPGTYTFYCTRWCGLNHWRMRGTIEVGDAAPQPAQPPLYVSLGLDIDSPHLANQLPQGKPSGLRGAALNITLPEGYPTLDYYRSNSPAQAWQALRQEQSLAELSDAQLWDLVARLWGRAASPEGLAQGKALYSANCAACHGETGAGDGVFADELEAAGVMQDMQMSGTHGRTRPADFTDPASMLGAPPAVLHGKILRGGMGTGMPLWGSIFTDEQIWNLVAYLYTFQFEEVRP
jgi:mono/diheme cytochrome c family protein